MEITSELGRNREKIGEVHDKVRFCEEKEVYDFDCDRLEQQSTYLLLKTLSGYFFPAKGR